MQLVLRHIKQGLEGVGAEISSQTSDAHSADSSTHQRDNVTSPNSAKFQVIMLFTLLLFICCGCLLRCGSRQQSVDAILVI